MDLLTDCLTKHGWRTQGGDGLWGQGVKQGYEMVGLGGTGSCDFGRRVNIGDIKNHMNWL